MSSEDIISLFKTNKNAAFNLLVDRYGEKVFNVCAYQLRSKEDAEDVAQESFTAIYLGMDTFKGNSKLSTWIYSIALNKCKEFIRNKTRKKRSGFLTVLTRDDSHTVPIQTIDFYTPATQLEDKERSEIFFLAVDQLAENQKQAYIFSKIEGYSYSEIADMMDLSVSSVESLLFRSKKRLKQLLEDYYEKSKE